MKFRRTHDETSFLIGPKEKDLPHTLGESIGQFLFVYDDDENLLKIINIHNYLVYIPNTKNWVEFYQGWADLIMKYELKECS